LLKENTGAREERVTIGTMVKLTEAEGGGKTRSFTVVRPADADPWEGRISEAAPIARAVLGHRVGDEVVAFTPGGERRYRIADARTA
jgi:transcription elongation factor GreA